MTDRPSPASPPGPLRDRSFRWLLAGTFVSNLGNQFTLIALPWTVLVITGDPLQLGLVLALIGIPRALFILLGGAVVDRHTPSRVLMLSKHANALLLALLALAIATGHLPLPLLYALALGLGVAEAFGVPAASSMLPQVVAPAQLPAANGLMMGQRQLSMFVGPLLAGLLVALADAEPAPGGTASPGLALAFAIDAMSFVLSAWTLTKVRADAAAAPARQPVAAALAEGLGSFWRDRDLRAVLLYGAAVALFATGPLQVALPVLANGHPALGAAALGSMLGAHGAGTLVGLAAAGARPRWRLGTLGLTVLTLDAVVGLLLAPLGHIGGMAAGVTLLLAIGVLGGFVQVLVFSWIQQRVAPAMMGRAMGLFMFIFVGLAPLSGAATGALLRWLPVEALFTGAGIALTAIALASLSAPRMRRLGGTAPQVSAA
jgi:MFS family permease